MQRKSEVYRKTNETDISLTLCVDGQGKVEVHTGFGLLDHMVTLIFYWADMDLRLQCTGDLDVDGHHTAEDCGITLGLALKEALGGKQGIARTGCGRVPMDEALADVCIDISGRPWLVWRGDDLLPPILGHEEKDLWREFYKAFASSAGMNIHVTFLYGKNGHHLLESCAKSFGVAIRQAVAFSGSHKIRSTKGELD